MTHDYKTVLAEMDSGRLDATAHWETIRHALLLADKVTTYAQSLQPVKAGSLPTINQDGYPGLGDTWVQLWKGDEVFARVYGSGPDQAMGRAKAVEMAIALFIAQLGDEAMIQQAEREIENG